MSREDSLDITFPEDEPQGLRLYGYLGAILERVFKVAGVDGSGDNEAGYADDGEFLKPSLGVVYKPDPAVAIKLDGSTHIQKFNGKTESYPEVRLDVSCAFKMQAARPSARPTQ